jgi:hypothetical protein
MTGWTEEVAMAGRSGPYAADAPRQPIEHAPVGQALESATGGTSLSLGTSRPEQALELQSRYQTQAGHAVDEFTVDVGELGRDGVEADGGDAGV